jgi:signal transduction histidine kinase
MTRRAYTTITLLVLGSLVGITFLLLRIYPNFIKQGNTRNLSQSIDIFIKNEPPLAVLDIHALFPTAPELDLLNPELVLPQAHRWPRKSIEALKQASEECRDLVTDIGLNSYELKAFAWALYRCNHEQKPLLATFFSTPPYMHPSGKSFVRLAVETGDPEFVSRDWIQSNMAYLHIYEYRQLPPPGIKLSMQQKTLADLDRDTLQKIYMKQSPLAYEDRLFFLQANSAEAGTRWVYNVYLASQWTANSGNPSLALVKRTGETPCVFAADRYCWIDVRREAGKGLVYGAIVAILILAMVSLALAISLRSRLRQFRMSRAHQALMLRTLTHELRTPAASIGLYLETLRIDFDQFPNSSQDAFLRICDQNQRLHRIIEGSTVFLRAFDGKVRSRFQERVIPSMHDFLQAVILSVSEQIEIVNIGHDRAFNTDSYWLQVCVKNLVENAMRYGRAPIVVRFEFHKNDLVLSVVDSGTIECASLKDLIEKLPDETKGRQGLGLGLGLVSKVLGAMGGRLEMKKNPTTFSIYLKEFKRAKTTSG